MVGGGPAAQKEHERAGPGEGGAGLPGGFWRRPFHLTASTTLLVIAVPLLVVNAVGYGLLYEEIHEPSSSTEGMPSGQPMSFTLSAYLTGYVGVGGSINGLRDPTLHVGWGDTVTLTIVDGEAMTHNLQVSGYGVGTSDVSAIGQQASVTFRATQEGSFSYYCSMPGHRESGMEGVLIVGESSSTPIGPEAPLTVAQIAHDPTAIPPPIHRNYSTVDNVYLEAKEVTAEIEKGVSFRYWTYNGTVPGPFLRVRVNDTVVVHLYNNASSSMSHSVDFHAVTGPGGGAAVSQTPPGHWSNFSFKALFPGLYVYHCGTPNIPTHIAMGMYGLILVEPEGGLPTVSHEFYLMEGELYTIWPVHSLGNQLFNGTALLDDEPTYVVFNGEYQGFTGVDAMNATVNDSVRFFFGNAGPNGFSAFHMIGAMFDDVWQAGDLTDPPQHNLQTVTVAPGSALVTQQMMLYPAKYYVVDHSIVNAIDKGAFAILNVTGWANDSIFHALALPAFPEAVGGAATTTTPLAARWL